MQFFITIIIYDSIYIYILLDLFLILLSSFLVFKILVLLTEIKTFLDFKIMTAILIIIATKSFFFLVLL